MIYNNNIKKWVRLILPVVVVAIKDVVGGGALVLLQVAVTVGAEARDGPR